MKEIMKENEIYEDEIDLFDLFDKLNKQKKLIIGITAISTILSIIISLIFHKPYKAEVFFEPKYINISEIEEVIKSYRELKNIKIKPIKNTGIVKIEIESKSPENAKKELETAINIINNDILSKKREEVSQYLNFRSNSINKAILEIINSENQLMYDLTKVVDLLTEKEQIERWLKNPNWILPISEILLVPDPIIPKPLIYTAIGFIGGLFLGIFIALLKDAIQNRKRENV